MKKRLKIDASEEPTMEMYGVRRRVGMSNPPKWLYLADRFGDGKAWVKDPNKLYGSSSVLSQMFVAQAMSIQHKCATEVIRCNSGIGGPIVPVAYSHYTNRPLDLGIFPDQVKQHRLAGFVKAMHGVVDAASHSGENKEGVEKSIEALLKAIEKRARK